MRDRKALKSALASLPLWIGLVGPRVGAEDPPKPATCKLKVDVTDVASPTGEVSIVLFASKAGFPSDFSKAARSKAVSAKTPTCTFDDLPKGKYAVLVFHDLNGDKKLDRNLLGFPKESIGLSNHPALGPLSPPNFIKAQIDVSVDRAVEVKMLPPPI